MGRMFGFVSKTWNPVIGCLHDCYAGRCWARIMARRLRGTGIPKYSDGFKPRLWKPELESPPKGELVFVVSMGDLFGAWVSSEWIATVLKICREWPHVKYWFFETKNPSRFHDFIDLLPPNSILSTTIETNRPYRLSKAPSVHDRAKAFQNITWPLKHLSLEPMADFDTDKMIKIVENINPHFGISIGPDNYGGLKKLGVPEPSLEKLETLAQNLEEIGFRVERKWER